MTARIPFALISAATFLASITLVPPYARALDDPNGVLSKAEQKCVVTINKNVAAVAKAQGKTNCACNWTSTLPGSTYWWSRRSISTVREAWR